MSVGNEAFGMATKRRYQKNLNHLTIPCPVAQEYNKNTSNVWFIASPSAAKHNGITLAALLNDRWTQYR